MLARWIAFRQPLPQCGQRDDDGACAVEFGAAGGGRSLEVARERIEAVGVLFHQVHQALGRQRGVLVIAAHHQLTQKSPGIAGPHGSRPRLAGS